jgi:transcriptional regulator with XRE-family HTH domain
MTAADIRAMRARANLTQTQFAQRLGVSRDYLANLENGKREVTRTMERALRDLERELAAA